MLQRFCKRQSKLLNHKYCVKDFVFVRSLSFKNATTKGCCRVYSETMLRLPGFLNVVRRAFCDAAEEMGKKGTFVYAVRKGFRPGVYQTWWPTIWYLFFVIFSAFCTALLDCVFSPKGRNVNIRWISFPLRFIRSSLLNRMLGPLWGASQQQHHLLRDQKVI